MEKLTVVPIVPCMDVAAKLRELADEVDLAKEKGLNPRVTCVVGTDIYCWGPVGDDQSVEGAIFDLTFAIHKLMGLPVKRTLERDGHT